MRDVVGAAPTGQTIEAGPRRQRVHRAAPGQLETHARAFLKETRRSKELEADLETANRELGRLQLIESRFRGTKPPDEFTARFERRIREVASRAVAHLKRGDSVVVRTTAGERTATVPARGADPLLRFLALLEATPHDESTSDKPEREARKEGAAA